MTVRILSAPESRDSSRCWPPTIPDCPSGCARSSSIRPGGPRRRTGRHAIVSSQLDADRLDYLARDALMAGIRTHAFDLGRLVRSLVVIDDHLVVDARAQDIVEAFLLALDQMYGTAYYHKTVRAASLLLEATIRPGPRPGPRTGERSR